MTMLNQNTTVGISLATIFAIVWALIGWHNERVETAVNEAVDDTSRVLEQRIVNMQIQSAVDQIAQQRERTDRKYDRMNERLADLEEITRSHIDVFDERIDEHEHVSEHVSEHLTMLDDDHEE